MVEEICVCPITGDIFKDPVMAADGQTYERYAITRWFQDHDTSPITGAKLPNLNLTPNIALRHMIEILQPRKVQTPAATAKHSGELIIDYFHDQRVTDTLVRLHLSKECKPPSSRTLILLVDCSISMMTETVEIIPEIDKNISRWNILTNAIKHLVKLLPPSTRVMTIGFSTEVHVLHDYVELNLDGRNVVCQSLNKVNVPKGCSRIWEAINMALKKSSQISASCVDILLFSDGFETPQFAPPRGLIGTLRQVLGSSSHVKIHTFGIGAYQNSKLLLDIASVGDGAFIVMETLEVVSSIMIHFVANLSLRVLDNLWIKTENGQNHWVGSMRCGETKYVAIPPNLKVNGAKVNIVVRIKEGGKQDHVQANKVFSDHQSGIEYWGNLIRNLESGAMTVTNEMESTDTMSVEEMAVKQWNNGGQHHIRCFYRSYCRAEINSFKATPFMEMFMFDPLKELISKLENIVIMDNSKSLELGDDVLSSTRDFNPFQRTRNDQAYALNHHFSRVRDGIPWTAPLFTTNYIPTTQLPPPPPPS